MGANVNTKMNILAAIGIIGVVLVHCGYEIINIFPQWRIPMFICLSGYFFQSRNLSTILTFVSHKFTKLILPVMGWQLFYGSISTLLLGMGLINYGESLNFNSYIKSVLFDCMVLPFTTALWFIPCLFYVQCVYVLLKSIYIYIYMDKESLSFP